MVNTYTQQEKQFQFTDALLRTLDKDKLSMLEKELSKSISSKNILAQGPFLLVKTPNGLVMLQNDSVLGVYSTSSPDEYWGTILVEKGVYEEGDGFFFQYSTLGSGKTRNNLFYVEPRSGQMSHADYEL